MSVSPQPAKAPLALRMDDVGACSKRYEVYSKANWRLGPLRISGNWLFLKYLAPFKQWGPYRELRAAEWHQIFELLESHEARLTVAVTASWAASENELIPFPQRFPAEAAALKEGLQQGLIEIANHGLTHCVLQGNAFKPKWFDGNRRFHREFVDWLPAELHDEHILRAQTILQDYFKVEVRGFVPPGNQYTADTLRAALRHGLRYTSCDTEPGLVDGMQVLGNQDVLAFHDRELVLEGIQWLETVLTQNNGRPLVTLGDLAQNRMEAAHGG